MKKLLLIFLFFSIKSFGQTPILEQLRLKNIPYSSSASVVHLGIDTCASCPDKYKLVRKTAGGGGGGTPAGSDREIQINNSGAFGTATWKINSTGELINMSDQGTYKFQVDGDVYVQGATSDGTTPIAQWHANNGGNRMYLWSDGHLRLGTSSNSGVGLIQADDVRPFVAYNSNAGQYSTISIQNDQLSTTRSIEMAYTGSTYAPSYLTGGVTGEQGVLYTTGAYPLIFGTNSTMRGQITSGGEFQFTQQIRLPEISTPSTPGSGFGNIYFKSDGHAYALNDAGTETDLQAGGGVAGTITGTRIAHGDGSGGLTTTSGYDITSGIMRADYIKSVNVLFNNTSVASGNNSKWFQIAAVSNLALDSVTHLAFQSVADGLSPMKTNFRMDRFGNTVFGGVDNLGGVASYYSNRSSSYTARSLVDKNYVDSSITAAGGGTGSNLSFNTGTHAVDIDGGGTSAVIPLATTGTNGLMSATTQVFDGTKFWNNYGQFENGLSIATSPIGSTAPAGHVWLYAKTDGFFYGRDNAGVETKLSNDAGGGTVTDFVFTDGNGFDGTVTSSTTTPTLSLTTTVSNTRVMYSNSGAIAGSANFTWNGSELYVNGSIQATASMLANGYQSNEIATPSTPSSGRGTFYFKADNLPYAINDAGVEMALYNTGGTASVATLTDVTLTSLATNDFLKYNGSVWINRTPANVLSDIGAQASDADLTYLAGFTPSANVKTILNAADYAAIKTAMSLTPGTDVQAFDADLNTIAGLTATTDNFLVSVSSAWASRTPAQVKTTLALDNVTNESKATMFTSPTFTGTAALGTSPTMTTPNITTGFKIGGAAAAGSTIIGDGTNFVSQNTRENWTTFAVTGSNATTTGQALTDVTGLTSGTLTNSTLYEVEAWLNVTTSAVTTGCQYAITAGGSGTAAVVQALLIGNSTGTTITNENIVASATATSARLLTSAQSGMMYIHGWVTTRGSGTANISIQHLKVTSGTSTVLIGSKLKIRLAN